MTPETCDECGFDSDEWDNVDTIRTVGSAPKLVELWTERMDDTARDTRPGPESWSVNEYVDHLRETFFGLRALAMVALEDPGTDLGPAIDAAPAGPHRSLDPEATTAEFAKEIAAFSQTLTKVSGEGWDADVVLGGERRSVTWATRHVIHDLWHHLTDIARIRIALGDPTPSQTGALAQVNTSGGGVPKLPAEQAIIGRRGLEGDVQQARIHHGRPWQALSLWSTDVIAALREEGHPIEAGNAGENLTLSGIDWSTLRAGAIVEIGAVRCQLSAAAVPCKKNNQWFADGDSQRIHHDRHPGWSRWYASVLQTGTVAPGDPVIVLR
jgi:MOSC domain-containing protein YiiM